MGKGRPVVKYRDALQFAVQKRLNRSRCRWVRDSGGSKDACIRWGPDPPWEGAIIRGKDIPGHTRRHSAVTVQNG